jgi:hypothetical protein
MFKHSSGLAIVLGFLVGPSALAQDDIKEIQKELTRLGAQLDLFQERLAELDGAQKDAQGGAPVGAPGPADEQPSDMSARLHTLEQAVSAIEVQIDNLEEIVRNQVGRQSADGYYVPNVLGNMQKGGDFRQEMMSVGKQIGQGRLVFDNQALTERLVYVNGSPWRVRTGVSHILVPRGRVIVNAPFQPEQVYEFADGADALRLTVSGGGSTISSYRPIIYGWPTVVTYE